MPTIGRNDPCPCGSGNKYKKCCLRRDEETEHTKNLLNRPFIAELNQEVEDQCDALLLRIESGLNAKLEQEANALHKKHPNNHFTNYLIGVVHIVSSKFKEAIPFFERAIEIYSYFAEAHHNLAECHLKTFELAPAMISLRNAIALTGSNDEVGKVSRSRLAEFEAIIRKNDGLTLDDYIKNKQIYDQAYQDLINKQYSSAIALFHKALEKEPRHVQTHGNLALAHAGLGQKQIALEYFDKAIALDPKYEPAIYNRLIVEKMTEDTPADLGSIMEIKYYADYKVSGKSFKKDLFENKAPAAPAKNLFKSWLDKIKQGSKST